MFTRPPLQRQLHSHPRLFMRGACSATATLVCPQAEHEEYDFFVEKSVERAKKAPGNAVSQGGLGHVTFPGAIGRSATFAVYRTVRSGVPNMSEARRSIRAAVERFAGR